MQYHRSDPKADDGMWHLECASVEAYCTGQGLDPGAGTRTMDADTMCLDLRPSEPSVRQGDAVAIPFEDGVFNYVVNVHLLEHLPDPRAAITEWLRVVKLGGHVCMVIPNTSYTAGQNTDATIHYWEWTPRRFVVEVLGIRLGHTQPWLQATTGPLTWAPATLVKVSEACPYWSFAIVLQKIKVEEP